MRTLMVQQRTSNREKCNTVYLRTVEITLQCPVCLNIETLSIEEGLVVPTGHWKNVNNRIYHRNCGQPARIVNLTRQNIFSSSRTTIHLKQVIEENGGNVTQFARVVGVSPITVRRWLTGKCHPNSKSGKKIVLYLKSNGRIS